MSKPILDIHTFEPGATPRASRNRILGSALIIAGTTIGAGMLSLPLVSANMGFGLTALALISMWALSAYTGLQFAEIYQHHSSRDGLARLASHYFGKAGAWVVTIILAAFMYAISAAYISGGGDILSGVLPVDPKLASVVFIVVVGLVILTGTRGVDFATRAMFVIKLATFALLMVAVLPRIDGGLLSQSPQHAGLYFSSLPVLFTSFGFHVVVPSVTEYLEGDRRAIRSAVLIGTGLPLAMYLLWQVGIHGLIPQERLMEIASLDDLSVVLGEVTGSSVLQQGFRVFGAVALITSMLGVGLALMHALRDVLGHLMPKVGGTLLLAVIAFLPPTLLATLFPQGFVALLEYAGVLAVMYIVLLPCLLLWRSRKRHPDGHRMVGSLAFAAFAFLVGLMIIVIPFLVRAGMLPAVAG